MARVSGDEPAVLDGIRPRDALPDYERAHKKAAVSLDADSTAQPTSNGRTEINRPPLRLADRREREGRHDPRRALYDPLRARLRHVHPARLAVHEVGVGRELYVEPHHVALARDVHERAVVRLDDRPVTQVWEVRLGDDVDYAPDRIYVQTSRSRGSVYGLWSSIIRGLYLFDRHPWKC